MEVLSKQRAVSIIGWGILGIFLAPMPFQTPAQDCVSAPPGLIGWWRGEGNAYDSSAAAMDGVPVGEPAFGPGVSGRSFVFNGLGDQYVALPRNLFPVPTTESGGAPFSFEFWFKTAGSGVILGQQDVIPFDIPVRGYVPAIYVGTNGLLHVHMFWGAMEQFISTNLVNDDRFRHLAVTYDGHNQSVYLDGQRVSESAGIQEGYASEYEYQLGTGYTGGWPGAPGVWFPFSGIIDEPTAYSRALNSEEVAAIHRASSAGKCWSPVLRHRYSFSEPAGTLTVRDSLRRADGLLLFSSTAPPYTNGSPDATAFRDGALHFAGVNGFVQLPPNLISQLETATLEAWVTWFGPATSSWQRIFDFGFSDRGLNAAATGTNYLILSPSRGGTSLLGFEQTTVNPFGSVTDPEALILTAPYQMPMGRELYLSVTYDPGAGACVLYVDGTPVSQVSGQALNALREIADHHSWLGKSQWLRDPHFNGSLNEFRIWDGVLPASRVAAHFAAGADHNFAEPLPPYLRFAAVGQNLVLSWPESASAYYLESAPHPEATEWLRVTDPPSVVAGTWRVILPIGDGITYYRLRK